MFNKIQLARSKIVISHFPSLNQIWVPEIVICTFFVCFSRFESLQEKCSGNEFESLFDRDNIRCNQNKPNLYVVLCIGFTGNVLRVLRWSQKFSATEDFNVIQYLGKCNLLCIQHVLVFFGDVSNGSLVSALNSINKIVEI